MILKMGGVIVVLQTSWDRTEFRVPVRSHETV
jgi:hypothetical protein